MVYNIRGFFSLMSRDMHACTHDGHSLLNGTEESLNHICRKLTSIGLNRLYINGNNKGILKSPQ
jgi:hypothetical protein